MELNDLKTSILNQINSGHIQYQDLLNYERMIESEFENFQKIIETAYYLNPNNKEIEMLFYRNSKLNASILIEKLYYTGLAIRKRENSDFQRSFEQIIYKLLEQTRAGKRDEVFYTILRQFVSFGIAMNQYLIEAFKPKYSTELFKAFIFSFLNGLMHKEEQPKED